MGKVRRGKPSSIDLLDEDIRVELNAALREKRLTQAEIREHFNQLLAERGHKPLSRSALSRYACHVEETGSRLREAREAAKALVGKLGETADSDLGRLLAEMVKTQVFDVLIDADDEDRKDLGRLKSLSIILEKVAKASRLDTDREMKMREQIKQETAEAVDKAARKAGISDDALKEIRAELGIVS
jgi:hypothetical protein